MIRALLQLALRVLQCSLHVAGTENIPVAGGAFLVSNHPSIPDAFLIGLSLRHRPTRWPIKVQAFRNPIVAYIARKMGGFPLRRESMHIGGVRNMVTGYRDGFLVVVFPEGTRSVGPSMHAVEPKFARLMVRLRAPLLPVGISGSADLMPPGSRFPRRHANIAITFGRPFELSDFYDQDLTPEVMERAGVVIRDRLEALRLHSAAELSRGGR